MHADVVACSPKTQKQGLAEDVELAVVAALPRMTVWRSRIAARGADASAPSEFAFVFCRQHFFPFEKEAAP